MTLDLSSEGSGTSSNKTLHGLLKSLKTYRNHRGPCIFSIQTIFKIQFLIDLPDTVMVQLTVAGKKI